MKVLAIGAHPDDIEAGCGGFIAKCINLGSTVYYIILSPCKKNTGLNHPEDTLVREAFEAASKLGVRRENITIYNFENTLLPLHAHEIRRCLERKQEEIKPDLVLCPFLEDPHQDHETVGKETIRVFRSGEVIISYEIIRHGSYTFNPNLFVDITDYINKKLEALSCFKSQLARPYFNIEVFKALAKTRAAQAGFDHSHEAFAEGFNIVKMFI